MANHDDEHPLDKKNVITPVFRQPGGAEVIAPNFESKDVQEVLIAGTKVRLLKRSIFETGVEGFVIPQWANKVSMGGIAYAGIEKFGDAFNKAYEDYLVNATDNIARVVMYQDKETKLSFFHTVTVQTGHLVAACNVSDAVCYVLSSCENQNIQSIGFPAMSTGIEGELEDKQSAIVMAHAIYKFSQIKPSDLDIVVAISGYDSNNRFKVFSEVFQNPELYKNFDPKAEVGTRREDVRRTLIEKAEQGRLPIIVIDKEGETIGLRPKSGATIHNLSDPKKDI